MASYSGDAANVISLHGPILTPQQEQEKWLAEGLQAALAKAATMKAQAKVPGNLVQVLKCAAQMLGELRTGVLSPPNYYELYVRVLDEIQHLLAYLQEDFDAGRHTLEEIYEIVQYTGNIVPRLYLLITAACVYMDSGDQPPLEIMSDLVEMCKGVQHPTRGLFLRNFLLTMMKGRLPGDLNCASAVGESSSHASARGEDDEETSHTEESTCPPLVLRTAELLLQNLKEMTWLWIRMEARGFAKVKPDARTMQSTRRTASDRRELCVLVGMNIVRVSQLDGIDRVAYRNHILPRVLGVIIHHREPIAQQYLMEVVVQVFPDDFHLCTLDLYISACKHLSSSVDVCQVLGALMKRLVNYAVGLRDGVTEAASTKDSQAICALFGILHESLTLMPLSYSSTVKPERYVKKTVSTPPPTPLPLDQFVMIMQDLCKLTLLIDKAEVEKVEGNAVTGDREEEGETTPAVAASAVTMKCYQNVSIVLKTIGTKFEEAPKVTSAAAKAAEKLLQSLIDMIDLRSLLAMDGLLALVQKLPYIQRRSVAMSLCDAALGFSTPVDASQQTPQRHVVDPHGGDAVARASGVGNKITTLEEVACMLELIASLLYDLPDAPKDKKLVYTYDAAAEFLNEQCTVSRVLHLIDHPDPAVYLKMLTGVRKVLSQGGQSRIPHTFPALAQLYVRAAQRLHTACVRLSESTAGIDGGSEAAVYSKQCAKAFHYLHSGDGKGILEVLAVHAPIPTFFTYLLCATTADVCELPETCYDLCVEAFTVYEENAADSRDQLDMLACCVNSLCALRNISAENYDVVATKVCQYCSKLMRKEDQSRMVAQCANLFTRRVAADEGEEGYQQRVLECLQRSMKIAKHVAGVQQFGLYVDLLGVYLQLFANKSCTCLNPEDVNNVLDVVREVNEQVGTAVGSTAEHADGKNDSSSSSSSSSDGDEDGKAQGSNPAAGGPACNDLEKFKTMRFTYQNTIQYIRSRAGVDPKWEGLEA